MPHPTLTPPTGAARVLLTMVLLSCAGPVTAADPGGWQRLEPGLELRGFTPPETPGVAPTINVLRIDPALFEFRLFNASAQSNVSLTPKQWAHAKGLTAVINASMFQEDLLTSVSLMRRQGHTNNAYQSKDKTMLAFDPAVPDVPRVKIIDRQCDDFETWKQKYRTLVQSIRMISCRGSNVWSARSTASSAAAVAMDHDGRVLFIHSEDALSTHTLINILMDLPLHIARAMYVEGGPQAQLYVDSAGRRFEFTGSLGAIFTGGGKVAWPLPNVIGIIRKDG